MLQEQFTKSWLLFNLFLTNALVYSVTDFLALQRCVAQGVISPVPLELVYKYFLFATKCFGEKNTQPKTQQALVDWVFLLI